MYYVHVYFSVAIIFAKQLISLPRQNLLALGGEDKCITVSNVDGDTIRQVCAHVNIILIIVIIIVIIIIIQIAIMIIIIIFT